MVKAARIYVFVIFALNVVLFAASLLLHIGAFVKVRQLTPEIGNSLFAGSLYVNFISAALAKEKNVWKNEFTSCPRWLSWSAFAVGIYGIVLVIFRVFLFPREGSSESLLTITALPLGFNALFVCIPYSLLWTKLLGPSELFKRVKTSFIAAIIGIAVLLLHSIQHRPG